MFQLQYNRQEIIQQIDRIVDKTFDMDMVWDWPCGVAYYGVCQAGKAAGKKEYMDRLQQWVDEYIQLGLPSWNVNSCAMGHCLLSLYEVTGDRRYWEIVEEKLEYLRHQALRFGEDVLQHTVSSKNDFPEQAWADTLFMAAFFMLRAGILTKDQDLISDALNQYYWHVQYLQNKQNGLWYHGYNHLEDNHMSGIFWGRANAWAAYTISQVGKRLPEPYLYPQFMELDCSLRDQLSALKKYQTENGLWRTIIDDEQSYEEVSASCGIAAAMIENGNILHTKYIQKALDGILNNISPEGKICNVSGGTAVMKDRDGYRKVPKTWTQGWGQGLALTFLAAVLENSEEKEQIER